MKKTILLFFPLFFLVTFHSTFAQVIYTDVVPDVVLNQLTTGNVTYNLDMNNDDTMDYQIINSYEMIGDTIFSKTTVVPESGNEVATDINKFPLAITEDSLIGANLNYHTSGLGPLKQIASPFGANPTFSGNWINGNNRFLGVHFSDHGSMKYGWVQMLMDENQLTVITTILAYAYDSSGAAITAYDSALVGIHTILQQNIPAIYTWNNSAIITFNGQLTEPMQITLLDLLGRRLKYFTSNDHQVSIDLSKYQGEGMLISVQERNITVTKKVFIN